MANGWKGGFERSKYIDGQEESMPALVRTEAVDHVVAAWSEDGSVIQLAKDREVSRACAPGRGTVEEVLSMLTLESTSSNCLNATFVRFEDYCDMAKVELTHIDDELDVFLMDGLRGVLTSPAAVSVTKMRAEIKRMGSLVEEYRNFAKYELVKHIIVDRHVMDELHCGCHAVGGNCSFLDGPGLPCHHKHTTSTCGGCLRFHRFGTRLYMFVQDIMNRCEQEFSAHATFARPEKSSTDQGTRFGPAVYIFDRIKRVSFRADFPNPLRKQTYDSRFFASSVTGVPGF